MQRKNYKPNKLMADIIAEGLLSHGYLQCITNVTDGIIVHHVQEKTNGDVILSLEVTERDKIKFFNLKIGK